MKKFSTVLGAICLMFLSFGLVGCNFSKEEIDYSQFSLPIEERMVVIDGNLYMDSGKTSSIKRTDVLDGSVKYKCDAQKIPLKNDCSNFGIGYGYQKFWHKENGAIEILIDDQWFIFEKITSFNQLPIISLKNNAYSIREIAVLSQKNEDELRDKFFNDRQGFMVEALETINNPKNFLLTNGGHMTFDEMAELILRDQAPENFEREKRRLLRIFSEYKSARDFVLDFEEELFGEDIAN